MFTLYSTALSANGRKALAVVRHLGLRPEIREVNVYKGEGQSPEYLAINPSGKIPCLVDGDWVLTESNAILLYLAEAHADYRLSSKDPRARADIVRWMFWESCHWQPTLIRILAPRVRQVLMGTSPPEAPEVTDWADAGFQSLAALLGAHLSKRSFLAGSEPSVADFSVAGMTTYFGVTCFPSAAHPAIAAWLERVEALPAWRETATAPWA